MIFCDFLSVHALKASFCARWDFAKAFVKQKGHFESVFCTTFRLCAVSHQKPNANYANKQTRLVQVFTSSHVAEIVAQVRMDVLVGFEFMCSR